MEAEDKIIRECSLRALHRDLAVLHGKLSDSQMFLYSAAQVVLRTEGCSGCVGTKLQPDSSETNLKGCSGALQSCANSEKP